MDNDFHVKLDGVKLTSKQKDAIERGIQQAVMNALFTYPNPDDSGTPRNTPGSGVVVIPPKHWRGFILRELSPAEEGLIPGLKPAANSATFAESQAG
ncbi:MAG: hypothetical protein JST32_11140 [Bacteroidetes bacterium]|nr:hypothetical protein [Bacteroidota bacterium]